MLVLFMKRAYTVELFQPERQRLELDVAAATSLIRNAFPGDIALGQTGLRWHRLSVDRWRGVFHPTSQKVAQHEESARHHGRLIPADGQHTTLSK